VARPRSSSAVLDASVSRPRPQPFPSRSRSALKRRAIVGALLVLALVLISISFKQPTSGAVHGVEAAGATVLRPFEVGAERVARPFRDVYGYFRGLAHAKRENQRLRKEVEQLRIQAIRGETAAQQNLQFRADLRYKDTLQYPKDFTGVFTRIIARPPSEFEQTIEIAAGSNDGIRLQTPIVTPDGLVGIVTNVSGDVSQVQLITDSQSAVQARDVQTGAIGLVRHGQGQAMILDRVTKDQRVNETDTIVTAGTRSKQYPSLYPGGIPIGQVTTVGQSDTSFFKQIQVQPYVDFSNLDSVIALVPKRKR
jgi:rod shape-determining protein MreC